MKILIVTYSFPKLSESFIYHKVNSLIGAGVKVSILIHSKANDAKYYDFNKNKFDIIESILSLNIIKLCSGLVNYVVFYPMLTLGSLWHICSIKGVNRGAIRLWILALPIISVKPDIVHFEFSGIGVNYHECIPILKHFGVRVVVSCRGAEEHIKPIVDPERSAKLKELFSSVDCIHCVSAEMADTIKRYNAPASKIFVNYPSVTLPINGLRIEKINKTKLIKIVSTGSLRWGKGYEYALIAMKYLKDLNLNIEYRIIGDGPEREKLTYEIYALGLTKNVFLLGAMSKEQVQDELYLAQIFLHPSLSEGLSNAILEAMVIGLPVIATDVGGTLETIEEGVEGLIISPRDPIAIQNAVLRIIEEPGITLKLGENGRKKVLSKFSLANQTRKYLDIYEELIKDVN